MTPRAKKVIVLGLDAPIPPRLHKYCKEGRLPALARLINEGVWAKNAMVPLPTITPSNWTSVATATWPSTHGITDFNVHNPGEALDHTHAGFYSGDVKAEWVWDAIARAGKKSVVVNWPSTWPPVVKDGIQIGGAGVEVNMWFYPAVLFDDVTKYGSAPPSDDDLTFRFAQHGTYVTVPGGEAAPAPRGSLSYGRIFSVEKLGGAKPVELKEASGWSNIPGAKRALEGELSIRAAMARYPMEPQTWHMLVLDTKGDGYDRVIVCGDKDATSPMAELKEGQWGPIVTREFPTEAGPKKASFTFKLLELSKDAKRLRLYQSDLCALDGWSYPESIAAEIRSEKGLPLAETGFHLFDSGMVDIDTVVEMAELQRQWFSDACTYLLKNKPWDLFMMHYHLPDHAWHCISKMMDPATAKSEAEWKKYQQVELAIYQTCDRLAADLMACSAENDTVFAIVSDHGAKALNGPFYNANEILETAGLQVRDKDGEVVWSKTKAVAQRSVYAYVNLKGRDPEGIVELGEEYRQVQDQIIKAVTDYVEPTTGIKPILFALRKEDARFINIYGPYVGDVVFAASERFGGEHGTFLPTAEWGLGSLAGVFAMVGPGIKKGVELERNVWCLDLVPTLCYLTGWPMPRDAEGAVIYQALEDPDSK